MTPLDILRTVIDAFEAENIRWCVIGGYATYPHVVSTDIDILVSPDHYHRAVAVVRRCADGHILQSKRYSGRGISHTVVDGGNPTPDDMVAIDILAEPAFDDLGLPVYTCTELLDCRVQGSDGLWVLPPDRVFVLYFAKRLQKSGTIPASDAFGPDQTRWLDTLYAGDRQGCENGLAGFLSPEDSRLVTDAAAGGGWQNVLSGTEALRRSFHRRALLKQPLSPFRRVFRKLQRLPDRLLRPNGLFVAILGPDGSGKTLLQQNIAKRLAPLFDGAVRLHMKPGDVRHSGDVEIPETDPHTRTPRGTLRSVAQIIHWAAVYIAGYWGRLYPLRVSQRLIVADRYHADLVCDPVRYRYGGPDWLARLLVALLPGPDLWLVLEADNRTLQSRTDELTLQSADTLRTRYLEFAGAGSGRVLIDAGQDADKVAEDSLAAIFQHMMSRGIGGKPVQS